MARARTSSRLSAGVLAFSLAMSWLSPDVAFACAFDMVKPERTKIDWIVEAENLVLARPAPDNPFAYKATRVLAGEDEGPPIGLLVDSASRRRLVSDPSAAILFAQMPDGGWHRVAYVDESFRDILETTLDHRLAWRIGMPQSRLDFITALQGSADPLHKAIVIGELDKVPYAQLRALPLRMSDEELLGELWTRGGYPYRAIRALLLGLTGTAPARAEIHRYIEEAEDPTTVDNLGAFAAAFIELEGEAGVTHLAQRLLLDPGQPLDKLEQVVMAMSVHHGLDNTGIQKAIRAALHDLVERRPEAGVVVARQFSLRSDWSQSGLLEPLVRDRKLATLGDLVTVSVYLARARGLDPRKEGGRGG